MEEDKTKEKNHLAECMRVVSEPHLVFHLQEMPQ